MKMTFTILLAILSPYLIGLMGLLRVKVTFPKHSEHLTI